jgi:hypothetical protein
MVSMAISEGAFDRCECAHIRVAHTAPKSRIFGQWAGRKDGGCSCGCPEFRLERSAESLDEDVAALLEQGAFEVRPRRD